MSRRNDTRTRLVGKMSVGKMSVGKLRVGKLVPSISS